MAMIGTAAKRAGCNVETIRYYERIGLLQAPPRASRGRRSYGEGEIERLKFIRRCRDLGFALKDVAALVELSTSDRENCGQARRMAEAQIVSVRQKMADLARVEAWLAQTIDQCAARKRETCPLIEKLSDAAPSAHA